MPKLRAVPPGEKPQKRLTVVEAAAQGDHRQMLIALQARIAGSVEAPSCNPVALAALGRQLGRLDASRSADGGGSGLDLTISREIMGAHGER